MPPCMKKISDQPHDRYFKDLLQDTELAKEFLINHLDQDIQKYIDWDTLAPYDASLVGENNKQLYADLVYVAKIKQHRAEVIIIFNHERKLTQLTPIRLLEYKLGALKRSIKQKQASPAFIIHITWYNGRQCPETYAQSILDYFTEKELAQKLFLAPCQIVHAHSLSADDIAKHEKTGILELFMRYGDDPGLLEWLEANVEIAKKLENNKYLSRSLDYLTDIGCHKPEDILDTFAKISSKLKEAMLTTAQQLRQQGIQQGMQQGMQQGIQTERLTIAKSMLRDQEPKEKVSKWTGLDLVQVERLLKELPSKN